MESGDTPSHLDPGLGLCDPAMAYGCTASSTRWNVISQTAFAHPENTTHFCCESIQQQSSHSELSQFGSQVPSIHNIYKHYLILRVWLSLRILLVLPIRVFVVALLQSTHYRRQRAPHLTLRVLHPRIAAPRNRVVAWKTLPAPIF